VPIKLSANWRKLSAIREDEHGNVAIVMALMAVTMMLCVGAAIDLGRWLHARDQTISAVDAAVLAGGRALQTNNNDKSGAVAAAQKYYTQNVTSRLAVVNDTVSFAIAPDGMGLVASGSAYIKTPFLQFASIDKLPLISPSQTQFSKSEIKVGGNGGQNIEVSLILDITGSMAGSRIADLKEAAKDLVNIIISDNPGEFTSKVALVPYSMGVNVGNYATTVRGSVPSGTKTSPGYTNYTFTNKQGSKKTLPISTCVSERISTTNAYTDVGPSTAKVGLNYASPSNPCPAAQIVPLSSDKTALTSKIDGFTAAGSTAGQIGIAWGWYMLSPNWGSVWPASSKPASYSDLTKLGPKGQPLLQKIAVLMTDGDFNTVYCNGVIAKDSGSGSGSDTDKINCNATNGNGFTQAQKLCDNMKKAGLTVYTVGFDVGSQQDAKNMMNKCATDAGKVYIADDGEQLKQAFRDIALKLSSLYISK
jgi:Flp pilus assembly protein TadG